MAQFETRTVNEQFSPHPLKMTPWRGALCIHMPTFVIPQAFQLTTKLNPRYRLGSNKSHSLYQKKEERDIEYRDKRGILPLSRKPF